MEAGKCTALKDPIMEEVFRLMNLHDLVVDDKENPHSAQMTNSGNDRTVGRQPLGLNQLCARLATQFGPAYLNRMSKVQ